jgi:AraC family transcriptional regulator
VAKIAIELERALTHRREQGTAGKTTPRVLASGDDWTVADVICTCGADDRAYEERHDRQAIAIALAGTFQYRCSSGRTLLTPGSLLLGNRGEYFECAHEHGEGDRCMAFWYTAAYFERLSADFGARGLARFSVPCLPPIRQLSAMIVRATAGVSDVVAVSWEELAVEIAACTVGLVRGVSPSTTGLPPNAEAQVTGAVRAIDRHPDATLSLARLAGEARLSPFHFLRTFKRVVGVTPHQYVMRARLREAASRLAVNGGTVLDVALDCGFGDVANFHRAFRAEFGVSPRGYVERRLQPPRTRAR